MVDRKWLAFEMKFRVGFTGVARNFELIGGYPVCDTLLNPVFSNFFQLFPILSDQILMGLPLFFRIQPHLFRSSPIPPNQNCLPRLANASTGRAFSRTVVG